MFETLPAPLQGQIKIDTARLLSDPTVDRVTVVVLASKTEYVFVVRDLQTVEFVGERSKPNEWISDLNPKAPKIAGKPASLVASINYIIILYRAVPTTDDPTSL